jgi:predicted hydrocarbon binding protein
MSENRKYAFNWELLGNIEEGRPNLGNQTRLEVYRLMQFCFRDVLEQKLGADETDRIFYDAGYLAGSQFYTNVIGQPADLDDFVKKLQAALKDLGIGILRVEEADLAGGKLVLTISEDLDCSGLPELNYEVCTYDEGFIAALLESFSGTSFSVKEVDCWCTGDRTCRFMALAKGSEANP